MAAGTGYWTQFVSQRAKSILATDITAEALAQINFRDTKCAVETRVADAYSMDNIEVGFDGAFAGLWFSHHCCPVNLNTDVSNTMILEVQLRPAFYRDMKSQNNGSLLPQGEG